MLLPAALLLTLTGVFSLYSSWRRREPSPVRVIDGWLLLLLAVPLWVMLCGPEFGVAYALAVPALAAWGLISLRHQPLSASAGRALKGRVAEYPGTLRVLQALAQFLLVTAGFGLLGLLITNAVAGLLPFGMKMNLLLTLLIFPLLWASLTCWFLAGRRRWSSVTALLLASASAVYLFV